MNRHVKIFGVFLIFFAVLASASGRGYAQSNTEQPIRTLRTALGKLDQAKQSKTRYTFLDLQHTQNFDEKGKRFVDLTQVFDVTYIADVQYSRLLEVDGKPLKGRALKEEQKRYDEAVRERSALDEKARAKIQHLVMKDAGIRVGNLSDYRSSTVDHAVIDGRDCLVIDLTPLADTLRKHFRLWIDPVNDEMLQMDFDQLADEGDMLTGSTGRLQWTFLDATPLLACSHIDANTSLGKKKVRVVVDHDYSKFRKFSVTTTIVPVQSEGQP